MNEGCEYRYGNVLNHNVKIVANRIKRVSDPPDISFIFHNQRTSIDHHHAVD
jgi:hypothetical protein